MNVKFRVHIQSSCTLMLLLPELDAWHYSYSKFGITRFWCEKANHHQGCLTCVMLQKGLHGWLDQYPLQPFIVSSSISFRKKLVLYLRMKPLGPGWRFYASVAGRLGTMKHFATVCVFCRSALACLPWASFLSSELHFPFASYSQHTTAAASFLLFRLILLYLPIEVYCVVIQWCIFVEMCKPKMGNNL